MVDAPPLRVVFLGTPQFAVPTLDALLGSRHAVVAAVTQPDRPRGRGQHVTDAPVKARAVAAGIPVLQPDRLSDPAFLASFRMLDADLGVVAAYGKILPESLIATPRLGMINVHASLLPRFRGAAPIHHAVMAGDAETGVTIMRVVKALDAGPMMAAATRPIGPDETSEEIEHEIAHLGAALLVKVADDLAAGIATETPQDDSASTYAPRLTKDDGIVDWHRDAAALHNQIRGLHPWPHAFSFIDGKRYILIRSALAGPLAAAAEPGTIVDASGDSLVVATGAGGLRLLQLQPEGKRPLSAREFLAGHPVRAGARFAARP
jgi:methionyl-tRNA formyltransferase